MNPDNTQEFEPRHRIVGAIVLVTVGVALFSLLLDEQPRTRDESVEPPADPHSRIVVTQLPSPVQHPAAVVESPPEVPPAAPSAPAANPADVVEPPPAPRPVPKPALRPTPKPDAVAPIGKYLVQVGTFSEAANAHKLRTRLLKYKYHVSLKTVQLDKGRAVRVLVGPYASKAKARNALDTIRRRTGLRGVVVSDS